MSTTTPPGGIDNPLPPPQQNQGIAFCLSGGSNNGNPALSLGGTISQVQPGNISTFLNADLGNVWDFVPTSEASAGFGPEYRCLYIQNNTGSTLYNVKVWYEAINTDSDIVNYLGVGTSAVNGTEQTIGAENIPPSGVSFAQPTSKLVAPIAATIMNPGDTKAIWVARSIIKGAVAFYADSFTLRAEGEPGTPSLITVNDWGFATAGGWSCASSSAQTNITSIINRLKSVPPMQAFVPLGELSMDITATCWFLMTLNVKNITHMTFGDSEMSTNTIRNEYAAFYGINATFNSFDYQNVHFLILNTEIAYTNPSPQYSFVLSDLQKASTNAAIDWIIVAYHQPIYSAGGVGDTGTFTNATWRDTYHGIFDQYGVDIVLQDHSHTYQRTYPLIYNSGTPSSPTVAVTGTNNYTGALGGPIFLTVGTGGTPLDTGSIISPPAYLAFSDTNDFGYLWITLTQSGSLLTGTFYNVQNNAVDSFTITKIIQ